MGPKSENRLETQTWSTPKGEPSSLLTVPGLTILGHPQIQRVGERAALLDLSSGRESLLSRGEPGFAPPGESALRPLGDFSPPPAACGSPAASTAFQSISSSQRYSAFFFWLRTPPASGWATSRPQIGSRTPPYERCPICRWTWRRALN